MSQSQSLLSQFNHLYDIHYKALGSSPPDNELMNTGLQIIRSPDTEFQLKEAILHKLIVVYPDSHMLYYYMADLVKVKTGNTTYALVWHKMCYRIEPRCLENLLDMLKILFDTENFNAIQKINDENVGLLYQLTDVRFRLLVSAYEARRRNFEKSVSIVHEILDTPGLDNYMRFICSSNIGVTYNDLGQSQTGIKFLTQAIRLNEEHKIMSAPDTKTTYDNLFITYDYAYNDVDEVWSIYQTYNDILKPRYAFPFKSMTNTSSKIVVGYISGDFSFHVVSNFIIPILKNHTDDFVIHCFSISPILDASLHDIPNTTFHDITTLDTHSSAKYVNDLGIDILIDLCGHSAKNRLEMLALNPAPVQMTYLGFPNTTGLSSVKYRITDSIADHPHTRQRYSEQFYRLPKCFLLFSPLHHLDKFDMRPTPRDHIVVGSMNKETKTSKALLAVWRDIMKNCERVKFLILLKTDTEARRQFYCDSLGVARDSERIEFVTYVETEKEYTQIFYRIDIMLDPFPYSGTTTSCKALYNSVPIVTKYHRDYHVHNVTASILVNTGLPELVAHSDEEYVSIVKELSENPDRIDEYKRTIAGKFDVLMEPKRFMQSYEKMLKNVYSDNLRFP
jgi:predicted O-linked N-acetylglucosamine transferase (SPINDLY family)